MVVSELAKEQHAALYKALQSDPKAEDLSDEIALLRTMLVALPDIFPRVAESPDRPSQSIAAMQLIEAIGRNVSRQVQNQYSKGIRLERREVEAFVSNVFKVITQNIYDPAVLRSIAQGLQETMPSDETMLPAPGV